MRRFCLILLVALCACSSTAPAWAAPLHAPEPGAKVEAAGPRHVSESARMSTGLDFLRIQEEVRTRAIDRTSPDRTGPSGAAVFCLPVGALRATSQPRAHGACTPADLLPYYPTAPPRPK